MQTKQTLFYLKNCVNKHCFPSHCPPRAETAIVTWVHLQAQTSNATHTRPTSLRSDHQVHRLRLAFIELT